MRPPIRGLNDRDGDGLRGFHRRAILTAGISSAVMATAGAAFWFARRPASPAAPDEELRRRIGQMLMFGFHGSSLADEGVRILREQIARGEVGGILHLGRNIADLDEVRAMNRAFLEAGGDLPPFIAVDQEGGRIQRLRQEVGFTETPSARWLADNGDAAAARRRYRDLARDLSELGFNTNLAPVVDLDVEPDNPIISRLERSYGADPSQVTEFAAAFVEAHREFSVATSLKHFPGHGSTRADSHQRLPDITASWSSAELEPYKALIARGLADMVMIGHLALRLKGDRELVPATLSAPVVTGLLRGQLGFDGLAISDDMDMGAITDHYDLADACLHAIRAGVDVLIVSNFRRNDPSLPPRLVEAIGRAAMNDDELRESIEASYGRILRLKRARFAAGKDGAA